MLNPKIDIQISLLEIALCYDQWWFGLAGIERGDWDGHLLYLERMHGSWKWDILWLRPSALKLRCKYQDWRYEKKGPE